MGEGLSARLVTRTIRAKVSSWTRRQGRGEDYGCWCVLRISACVLSLASSWSLEDTEARIAGYGGRGREHQVTILHRVDGLDVHQFPAIGAAFVQVMH